MELLIIVALVFIIPILLFAAAIVWFMNICGLYTVVKETQERWVVRQKGVRTLAEIR